MSDPAAALADACHHHRANRLFEAAALCRQMLEETPDHAGAQHLLGMIAYRLGNTAAAIDWLEKAVKADAGAAAHHDDLGLAYGAVHRFAEAAASHRRALAFQPESAVVHFHLGNALVALGEKAAAADCYRTALGARPDYPDALANLGLMLFDDGQIDEAMALYRRALALDPASATVHNNLGNACVRQGDFVAATASYEQAIKLDPRYVAPHINLGNAMLERGDPATAIACYDSALCLAPDQVEAHRNLGLVRLLLGDFAGGWPEWRWPAPGPARFPQPEWRGEPLDGAAILLHAEQGFGDILQFVRYVPLVAARGGRVILEVPGELRRLLGCMAGADAVVVCGEALPDFAWHCSLLSLPLAFGTELGTIPDSVPYIEIPATAALPPVPGTALKVGLVWAGRPEHNRDRIRSLPLAALASLARLRGVAFYSLQKGTAMEQIADAALPLVDLASRLDDFVDTAAAIAALDLVITVDTSVAHLAGALGRPVWLLLPQVPDWRWLLGREDSPWYPSARLFRQPIAGDWQTVVDRVAVALEELASANRSDKMPPPRPYAGRLGGGRSGEGPTAHPARLAARR